jgi:hypothetical protein
MTENSKYDQTPTAVGSFGYHACCLFAIRFYGAIDLALTTKPMYDGK